MQLQEALAVVKAEVRRRIQSLQDMESQCDWLGSLTTDTNTNGFLTSPETWPSLKPPATAVMHVPQGAAPRAAKIKAQADACRRSKWYEPVGKALVGGPKSLTELETVLGVAPPSFIGPVLRKYNHLFRKNGEGRGSTWELTEAGKREFAGKA